MGYIIIYRRYRNRVAEMLRGFFMINYYLFSNICIEEKTRKIEIMKEKYKKVG